VSPPLLLMKAIRSGRLADVIATLEANAEIELNDAQGGPGLPMAIACFMGSADIVRELGIRGAKVNCADNRERTSPLALAVSGGKSEVVKVLIELGAELPPDMETGLSPEELTLAKWKALHLGVSLAWTQSGEAEPIVEEIEVRGCYGTDTNVLDAETRRLVQEKCSKPIAPLTPRR